MARCELTHLSRSPIDIDRAAAQHAGYERALADLGCSIQRLPAAPHLADSVFVEDIAIVLDEIAIIARPGAESRRGETAGVEEYLKRHRILGHIDAPGTLDGGDVLVIGRSMFVGSSRRTNASGIEQVQTLSAYFGYTVAVVPVHGCLHLKSAVTALDDMTVLINPDWTSVEQFRGLDRIEVDPGEPAAANIVRADGGWLYPAAFPRTHERLERRGRHVTTVDISEIAKAEGAVTCCSIIFRGEERDENAVGT
jgi:dimethylargininase